ncbi:MAG TPA: hypothetical protein VGE04_09210 [Chloroflexia bacterium]|jgi:hypothetical protein
MEVVNTNATAIAVQHYSSPLRITAEAVELRDIAYPLPAIKSAEVIQVATNKGNWDFGIFFFDIFGSFLVGDVLLELRIWERPVTAQDLARLFATAAAYLLIAYLLRWLYKRRRKSWPYIYTADLSTDYGRTMVAASSDKTYIENIVSNVSAAIAGHLEAPVTYDNYFRVDDSKVSVPGWSAPISDIKSASRTKLQGRNYYLATAAWQPVVILVLGATIKVQAKLLDPNFFPAVWGTLIAILLFANWWVSGRKRVKGGVPTINHIHVGWVYTGGNTVPVLMSIDYGFVDKFVTSINETVRKRSASTRKPTNSTRSTRSTT